MDEQACLGYIATNIRARAQRKRVAINTLADLSGVSRATMWAILAEKHFPTVKTLVRIANALECKPGRLLDGP